MSNKTAASETGSPRGRRTSSTGSTRRDTSKRDKATKSGRKFSARTPELANIEPDKVRELASFYCTNREIAAFFGISEKVLAKHFAEEIATGRDSGAASLRRMQFEAAKKGSTAMLIWLGKQILGQRDDPEPMGGTDDERETIREVFREMVSSTMGSSPGRERPPELPLAGET